MFLSTALQCQLNICLSSYSLNSNTCDSLTSASQLIPYTLSGPCAYMMTKYICTYAYVSEAYNTTYSSFGADDCNKLSKCLVEPSLLSPFCSSSYLPLPSSALTYNQTEAQPFITYFDQVKESQPCPTLDRYSKTDNMLKYLFGESYYYLNISTLNKSVVKGLTLLDIFPKHCDYSKYKLNNAQSEIILSGTTIFIFLLFITTIIWVIRRKHTPLKQRGIVMQIVNNLALASSMWLVLEIDTFGYTASCGNVIIFANLALPLIAVVNLSKGIQLFLVYSWEQYKSLIDINIKEQLKKAGESFLFKFRYILSEKGSIFLITVLGVPVLTLFLLYSFTFIEDFKGSLLHHSYCEWWNLSGLDLSFLLTPSPHIVPVLTSCQVCSFTNKSFHTVPTITLICTYTFILTLILYKIKDMHDQHSIHKELYIISFVNIIIYPIAASVFYPDVYDSFLIKSIKLNVPALLFSLFLVFNFVISSLYPLYLSFDHKKKESVDEVKEVTILSESAPTATKSSYLPPYKTVSDTSSYTGKAVVNNFFNSAKNSFSSKITVPNDLLTIEFRRFCQERFESSILDCFLLMRKLRNATVDKYGLSLNIYNAYFTFTSPLYISILQPYANKVEAALKVGHEAYLEKADGGEEYKEAEEILFKYLTKETLKYYKA
jgi:hypothetical protein